MTTIAENILAKFNEHYSGFSSVEPNQNFSLDQEQEGWGVRRKTFLAGANWNLENILSKRTVPNELTEPSKDSTIIFNINRRNLLFKTLDKLKNHVKRYADETNYIKANILTKTNNLSPNQIDIIKSDEYEIYRSLVDLWLCSSFFFLPIKPDGNCFYRAISFVIFGNEDNHGMVRNVCVYELCENLKLFSNLFNQHPLEGDLESHILESCKKKTWANQFNIQAVSFFLKRDILIFSPNSDKTSLFCSHYSQNLINVIEKNPIMLLCNNCHFEPLMRDCSKHEISPIRLNNLKRILFFYSAEDFEKLKADNLNKLEISQ